MPTSPQERCGHILEAIANIRTLLDGRSPDVLEDVVVIRPAVERHLEIISEAIRHLPSAMLADFPLIPWADIAALGNRLRHGYDRIRADILWNVYVYELDALGFAITRLQRRLDE